MRSLNLRIAPSSTSSPIPKQALLSQRAMLQASARETLKPLRRPIKLPNQLSPRILQKSARIKKINSKLIVNNRNNLSTRNRL